MSCNINQAILIGRLAAALTVRVTPSGKRFGELALATEHYHPLKGEQTLWHQVHLPQALSDHYEHRLKKGERVFVEGKIRYLKHPSQHDRRAVIKAKKVIQLDEPPCSSADSVDNTLPLIS